MDVSPVSTISQVNDPLETQPMSTNGTADPPLLFDLFGETEEDPTGPESSGAFNHDRILGYTAVVLCLRGLSDVLHHISGRMPGRPDLLDLERH